MELARLAQNRSDSNYARFWSERPPSKLVRYARIGQLRQNSSAYAYPLISAYAHMLRFQAHRVSVLSDLLKQPDKQKSARPPLELVTARGSAASLAVCLRL